jgi:hypothetical protein
LGLPVSSWSHPVAAHFAPHQDQYRRDNQSRAKIDVLKVKPQEPPSGIQNLFGPTIPKDIAYEKIERYNHLRM